MTSDERLDMIERRQQSMRRWMNRAEEREANLNERMRQYLERLQVIERENKSRRVLDKRNTLCNTHPSMSTRKAP